MYFVYVLQNECGNQYVGFCLDTERRLREHNSGKTKSTANRGPWNFVCVEKMKNRLDARAREKYLKSAAGRRFRRSLGTRSSAGYPPERTGFTFPGFFFSISPLVSFFFSFVRSVRAGSSFLFLISFYVLCLRITE